jgi:23S rRNA (adenine2503-C2)-methyltransferase
MKTILDLTRDELEEIVTPKFRAKQIYHWIYQKYAESFNEMVNIPKELREKLSSEFIVNPLELVNIEKSSDGSKKYLFRLHDGYTMETVLLPMKKKKVDEDGKTIHLTKYSICVSSQVGCKIGCAFCLTAKEGFKRNLTSGEILAQVIYLKRDNDIAQNRSLNIVYMGMGEPLDNMDNVVKAIKMFKDPDGLAIGARRQTLSTSGLSHQIEKLGKMDLGILLAISLHAVDDELREKLMPINKAYNIESVINAVKNFPIDARKRVMFEYLVMKGLNDDRASAKKLVKLLHGIKAKVNLIYFNPYPNSPFKRPTEKDMMEFKDYLNNHGVLCTIRQSKGLDISAACGQLKEKVDHDLA